MPEVFLTIALILLGVAALLRFAGERRLLNFVDYAAAPAARINRHGALRLPLPACHGALPLRYTARCAGRYTSRYTVWPELPLSSDEAQSCSCFSASSGPSP